MKVLVLDTSEKQRLIRRRRSLGIDQPDEVWNDTYIVFPPKDNEHQQLRGKLSNTLAEVMGQSSQAKIYPGVNVSDRREKWKQNYRCPDVVVYLPGTSADDCFSHYRGGPDLAIEILSPRDLARKKLGFYAGVGTRELLLIDRKPWALELYRLADGKLKLVGKIAADSSESITSEVLPISLRLLPGDPRPTIELTQTTDARQWLI